MWSGHLPARINILANDRPTLSDASGALSTRFYTFILRVSFLDREDEELSAKLAAEIPSILNWALAGGTGCGSGGSSWKPKRPSWSAQIWADLAART